MCDDDLLTAAGEHIKVMKFDFHALARLTFELVDAVQRL